MKREVKLSKICFTRLLIILILITALVTMEIIERGFLAHSNGAKLLDMRFGYDMADVFQLFKTLGVEGRSIYIRYLCDDFIFIASFAIVQNYILKFTMSKAMLNSKWRILLAIAYLRAFFDATENIILLILLNKFPLIFSLLVTIVSSVTKLKFILLVIWILAIPTSLVARLMMKNTKVEVV